MRLVTWEINFDFDFEAVIQCAVEHNVAIEINNTTLKGNSRVGSVDRCYEIARIAREKGAFITTGSDAHFCQDVSGLNLVASLLDEVGVDSSKVITHSPQQFLSFLALRGRSRDPRILSTCLRECRQVCISTQSIFIAWRIFVYTSRKIIKSKRCNDGAIFKVTVSLGETVETRSILLSGLIVARRNVCGNAFA